MSSVLVPLLLSLLLAQAEPTVPVRFEGNLVLPNEVYAAVLQLPPDARAEPETAAAVKKQLHEFLLRSGYELAQVEVTIVDDGLLVRIDEGQLERLVFRGRVTLQMVRFRLALDLPQNVFNRPLLEREVAKRAREFGLDEPQWALVPSLEPPHTGLQLQTSSTLVVGGRPLIRAAQPWELHFRFGERGWSTGLGIDLRSSWLNGVELGANYQGGTVAGHRWRAALSGGLGLRRDLPRRNIYITPTRAHAELIWFTPGFDAESTTRAVVELNGEYFVRQRRDFGLENYSAARTDLTVGLAARPNSLVNARLSAGVQYFRLMQFTAGEGATIPSRVQLTAEVDPWRVWAFGEAKLELTFFDGGNRSDHRHALLLSSRVSANLTRANQPLFFQARFAWQFVVPIGWHELWFNASGLWLSGDVPFPYEDVMGQHLPAVFSDVWLRKVLGASVGFRYSLLRDQLKVGLFAKGLAYGEEKYELDTSIPRAGVGAGPSMHLLIFDLFQLDLFVDVAVLSNGRVGAGVLVWLNKVF
jgi:hypothetical protein